jgi:uncharacterized protein (TIGR00251 family)
MTSHNPRIYPLSRSFVILRSASVSLVGIIRADHRGAIAAQHSLSHPDNPAATDNDLVRLGEPSTVLAVVGDDKRAALHGWGRRHHADSRHTDHVRLEIHVRPNASRTVVGGTHDGAMVVRVASPAKGGKATRAALEILAETLGVPRGSVTLVRGPASRRKLVDIHTHSADEARLTVRVRQLLVGETRLP